ncbi:MAG: hypothetical protein ACK47B_06445 [Armatimonadota bacterium]
MERQPQRSELDRSEGQWREEVRPGLVMIRRRIRKDDGRYLLYYDFERSPVTPGGPAANGE